MKQAELLRLIAKAARTNKVPWGFVRHGGKHDIYEFNGTQFEVPRHKELSSGVVDNIRKRLGI